MNENTENSGNEFFYDLLDSPADLSHSNAFNLQLLVNDYPQSSLLRAMLCVKGEEDSIRSASAYVNPKLLYKIANAVNSLSAVADEQIILSEKPGSGKTAHITTNVVDIPDLDIDETNYFHVPIDNDLVYFDEEETEDVAADAKRQNSEEVGAINALVDEAQTGEQPPAAPTEYIEQSQPSAYTEDKAAAKIGDEFEGEYYNENKAEVAPPEEEAIAAEPTEDAVVAVQNEDTTKSAIEEEATPKQEDTINAQSTEVAAATLTSEYEEYMSRADNATNALNDIGEKPIHPHQEIDDDVFEEIVSIEDIGLEQLAITDKVTEEPINNDEVEIETVEEEAKSENNYEIFEPTLPEDEAPKTNTNVIEQYSTGRKAGEPVAKYNDEKMPYSFMWWLDKTRKEHATVYQPFAEGKLTAAPVPPPIEKPQPRADHLQQQYLENIFTVSAVVSDLNSTPAKVDAPPPADEKVDKIIERFIQEEPQIKHPAKAKLDNENKAKKSSEDRDELVTETLAKIYTEQMLYHKAILTYKKLMLKFPEKSLYFAGQIEQLEKKIN